MSNSTRIRPSAAVLIAAVAGTLAVAFLALVTFGAQATTRPEGVPVAVAIPSEGPAAEAMKVAAGNIAGRAGERLDVTVTNAEEARTLLQDKEVYGVLELGLGAQGPEATVVVSGAVNPAGTQVAQQALTQAGTALVAMIAQQNPQASASPVQVEELNPATSAGRVAPLAVSALAWIGCMVAGAALTMLALRSGNTIGAAGRIAAAVTVSVLVTALLAGAVRVWDGSLPLGWDVIGLILLTTLAFATVQGGLLHWLGIRAMAILAPLYLVAPAVAGQVPELLHPAYRDWLWSWTPFRFPTEALRSLLNGTPDAPDVMFAVWVLAGMLAVGLVIVALPRPSAGKHAEADSPNGVVDVGVNQADRLPSA